jgi:isopenicillin N synthase-like dioxygenase
MTEAWEEKQKARRVLGAAVAEAEGKPDQHVFALPVMRRAGLTNVEFRAAARYLDEQGWIAEGRDDYETFVVTSEGIDRVTEGRDEVPGTERPEPNDS